MNILIPMAGNGNRFLEVGYNLPKPLIDVNGKPMIECVIDSLDIPDAKYIFIVRKEHIDRYYLDNILKDISPDCIIIEVDGLTEGQASTALLAKRYITDDSLLIINCDNYFNWESDKFLDHIDETDPDGMIFTFEDFSENPGWSYAEVGDHGKVIRVAEKEVISNVALAGAFYWKHGKDFIRCTETMISKNIRTNNEFYITPSYNEAITEGLNITNFDLEMKSMDTPEDLEKFKEWLNYKTTSRKNINKKLQSALNDIRYGKPIILVDEYDRENEGDIVIAAEKCSRENLIFTMNNARGLMCIPCDGEILDRLKIPPMVKSNTDSHQTPFTVSIDARDETTTGMSVDDRLKTISVILDPDSNPKELTRPGHLFPLRPRDNLLQDRRGHTEGSVELMYLAGLKPVAMICEIMNDDGSMAKGSSLIKFASKHDLNIISIEEVYEASYNKSI